MAEEKKIGYQKAWHIQVPGLKLVDFTRDRHGIITLDQSDELRLFDEHGNELWHRPAGYKLVCIALADTLEVLAVDEEKFLILYGPEGTTMWRKRPFPGVFGRISASGDFFSFVTSDPAIIGTDRALRVRWAYRNLMKRPADLSISGAGQITCFPSADDRGDGIIAVNHSGKPYDPFLGMKTVVALDISEDGHEALALDHGGNLFCVNPVKGYGIWKGKSSPRNTGVSFADNTKDSIVYSDQGKIVMFDSEGNQIWDYNFPERLLKAFLSPDSQSIFYASERGEIGCLKNSKGEVRNQVEFLEKQVSHQTVVAPYYFRKLWSIELNGSREHNPEVCCWLGHEGVDYSVVWNGADSISCFNDVGEEIWSQRYSETTLKAISASADADLIVAVTNSGVIGFDIDGNESFKIFGSYADVFVFPESSLIFVSDMGKVKFYQSHEHFSHIIESEEKLSKIIRLGDNALLVRKKSLQIVDFNGNVIAETGFESAISYLHADVDEKLLVVGEENGKISTFNFELEKLFSYKLSDSVAFVASAGKSNELYVSESLSQEIIILRLGSNELLKTSLTGKPVSSVKHPAGLIVGTDLDQIGLVDSFGNILGRYTCPERIIRLINCRRQCCFWLLTEDSLCCVAAVKDTRTFERK
jgi:hypothetical protein